MDEWLRAARSRLAASAGVAADSLELDEQLLLDVARVAAHDSGDRTNAPLTCYLLGLAVARSGRDLRDLADVIVNPDKPVLSDTAAP